MLKFKLPELPPDPHAALANTLAGLAATDGQTAELLRTLIGGFAGLALRIAALESASVEQRNLLAGAVDLVNGMRGVMDLFNTGFANVERRLNALERMQALTTPNGEQQLQKMGFDA